MYGERHAPAWLLSAWIATGSARVGSGALVALTAESQNGSRAIHLTACLPAGYPGLPDRLAFGAAATTGAVLVPDLVSRSALVRIRRPGSVYSIATAGLATPLLRVTVDGWGILRGGRQRQRPLANVRCAAVSPVTEHAFAVRT